MIKVIYGKTGEGKTWEVINEILQIEKGLKVGVLLENTLETFFHRLEKVMSTDEIINKKLLMVNQTLTPKEALENIKNEDINVFIIDVNHPIENYIDELRESKIPKIIITQQIKTRRLKN